MKEKRPTKRQMKYAAEHPFVCPSCELRFKTREARQKHWNENDTCHRYQFDGKLAVKAFTNGDSDALYRWFERQPKKILEEGL